MTHEEAVLLLAAYVDRELADSSALAVADHAGVCQQCREELEMMAAMRSAVREDGRYHRAPGEVRAALAVEEGPREPGWLARLWSVRWVSPALAAGAAAAISSIVTLQLATPAISARLSDELITNHVRSLVTKHLLDVASSDQHTVKPWFAGRLDFSPPVQDLAPQGFPLIGARLEYLRDRPVAALVYRKAGHFIDVYVRPDDGKRASEMKEAHHRGFNLVAWSDSRFTYDAVSDMNMAELREFVAALEAAR